VCAVPSGVHANRQANGGIFWSSPGLSSSTQACDALLRWHLWAALVRLLVTVCNRQELVFAGPCQLRCAFCASSCSGQMAELWAGQLVLWVVLKEACPAMVWPVIAAQEEAWGMPMSSSIAGHGCFGVSCVVGSLWQRSQCCLPRGTQRHCVLAAHTPAA
jgi:hypothetical protein